MIRLYFAALLVTACAAVASATEHHLDTLTDRRDLWTTPDKGQHAAAGFLIAGGAYLMIDELAPRMKRGPKMLLAFAVGLLVGAAKEVSDYQRPKNHDASLKDFACTAGGSALGAVSIGWVIDF